MARESDVGQPDEFDQPVETVFADPAILSGDDATLRGFPDISAFEPGSSLAPSEVESPFFPMTLQTLVLSPKCRFLN